MSGAPDQAILTPPVGAVSFWIWEEPALFVARISPSMASRGYVLRTQTTEFAVFHRRREPKAISFAFSAADEHERRLVRFRGNDRGLWDYYAGVWRLQVEERQGRAS